jgi:Tfp pilus assembly protein PilF
MAYFRNGHTSLAEKELSKALELSPTFDGSDEAKKTLAEIRERR